MAGRSNTRVKHKLLSGKHHRVDRKTGQLTTFRAGESFEPTERERQQNHDRLVRSRSVFISPGIPGQE